MSSFSKLFGGASGANEPTAHSIEHNGFQITPTPKKETNGHRIAATITKDGKEHHMIRADTYGSKDQAVEASVAKAKQFIDQMGDRIFD